MTHPTLYKKSKLGKIVEWTISSEGDEIITRWGESGGKIQESREKATAMNEGKKNYRGPKEQAEFQAGNEWAKQLGSLKYFLTVAEAQIGAVLPMTAHEYRAKDARWPAYVQPKLDGARALAFWQGDRVVLRTRGGKEWTACSHIIAELEKVMPRDMMLDGELYIHGMQLEEIMERVKKNRGELTEHVKFHVYDMPMFQGKTDLKFEDRDDHLELFFVNDFKHHAIVDSMMAKSEEEAWKMEEYYVEKGYEGAMLRNADSTYLFAGNSRDLLKLKTFVDAEFVIVDIREGKGKYEGKAVFICRNDTDDQTFETDMNGDMTYRAELYDKRDELIGQLLTVKYFGKTKYGLPRFPKAKAIRPVEDLEVK